MRANPLPTFVRPMLLAVCAGLAMAVCGWAEDAPLEDEVRQLIKKAAAQDMESDRSEAGTKEFLATLEQLEEKIIYMQGIGSVRPITFLAGELKAMQSKLGKLQQARESMLRKKLDKMEQMAKLQEDLAKRDNANKKANLDELRSDVENTRLPKMPLTVYWLLVRGLSGFGKDSAIAELTEVMFRNRKERLGRDIMFGLQGNRAPSLVDFHEMVIQKGSEDLAVMAAEQLAEIKQERSVDVLVAGYERHKSDRRVQHALGEALTKLTGQPHGDDGVLWHDWWSATKAEGVEQKDSGRFGRAGNAVESVAEPRVIDTKVLVLTQQCTKPNGGRPFDQIEMVCAIEHVKYDIMQKTELNESNVDLDQYAAILVNCTQFTDHCHGATCTSGGAAGFRMNKCGGPGPHDTANHRLDDSALKRIKKYVANGGYLFTEDWGLLEIISEIYPSFVTPWPTKADTSARFLREMDVDVNPVPGVTSHHLLRGVYQFHEVDEREIAAAVGGTDASVRVGKLLHQWHIDAVSPAMIVGDRDKVTILISSNTLAGITGTDGACAVTFFPGSGRGAKDSVFLQDARSDKRVKAGGRVLHILSHLTKQANFADDRAIKRLILNFVDEAFHAWDARQRRGKK